MTSLADETRWMDAVDQAALVAKGEVTPIELLDAAIARIEETDPALNALTITWFDHARRLAADPALPDGPFRGVPFLLKDLYTAFAGQTLSNGNVALKAAGIVDTADTTLVARHRAAGLVIAGRTNSPEMGSLPTTQPAAWGPTRNPWDRERTPGGSSGGAAAAVAAGMVPFANASDGGGSIRIPASACGLVGLKPSQGRITVGPVRAEVGLGVEHCVSRSVRDSAVLLDATRGPGVGDTVIASPPERPYADEVGADPGRLRIGLLDRHPRGEFLHDDCVAAARAAAVMLEGLGHDVQPGAPDALRDESVTMTFMVLWATQMAMAAGGSAPPSGARSPRTTSRRSTGSRSSTPSASAPSTWRRPRPRCTPSAATSSSGGPTAGTSSSRRRLPNRRRCSASSSPSMATRPRRCVGPGGSVRSPRRST